jgi:hypothetical protein
MLSTRDPFELESGAEPELESPRDPGFGGEAEGTDAALTEEQAADWDSSYGEGALDFEADAARKQDEDDDSDFGFDDFDYEDEDDEDEDLDDDFDDEEDELDEDFDEFEETDET